MTTFDAFIYGLIQGLSEFLPISSSGHLALLPYWLKIQDPGVMFDLMMHLGTALAVSIYFHKEIMGYARTLGPSLLNTKHGSANQWYSRNFILATLVSVVLIVLLMPVAKLGWARNPYFISFNLFFFGLFLWLADRSSLKNSTHLDAPMESGMQWKLAMLIGAAQALAIFPGVSRSGITLTMALFLGMKRRDAGSFSFLMSLPIILAGIAKEIPHLAHSAPDQWQVLLTGVLTSFAVGLLTIHYFMKLIGHIKLIYFTGYRFLIAGLMLWFLA